MTDEQIAAECERLFQNGGPKVYIFDPERSTLRAAPGSAKTALRLDAYTGQQVWQRRKQRRVTHYEFVKVGTAT